MTSIPTSEIFRSILWPAAEADAARDDTPEPTCFHDLNLDQVVAAIAAKWPEENLAPFFRTPLQNIDAVVYRHAVFRDLERAPMQQALASFVESMRAVHARLASIEKLHYLREKQRAQLGAAEAYVLAIRMLLRELGPLQPASSALHAFNGYLADYTASDAFTKLAADTQRCLVVLDGIRYGLVIRESSITVRPYADEADASAEIEDTFARFRRNAAKDYRIRSLGRIGVNGINHVEAQVLDKVASLHPEPFATLDAFCDEHDEFVDATLDRFARETCFYLAWLAFTAPMRLAGLTLSLPEVDARSKSIDADDAFDIALAAKRVHAREPVVCNGFTLRGEERIIVVSGPNNGGKTTFARMFGQLHWLAALGLTVPARHAHLFLFDHLFTHFERQESIETLSGKLQDDLNRIHAILADAGPRSVIVLNEIFASTTLEDALALARRMLARISQLDALAVCVTFLVELAEFDEHTISMVAEVDPEDPAIRTFAVRRRPADGLAYALAVANKYRVTREWLLRRIAPCKRC